MPINSEKPVLSIRNSICDEPYKVISRPGKGLVMKFFSDCVLKDYSSKPEYPEISRREQTRRLVAEIAAYRRFEELECPFVPKLLEASVEQRWFSISLIPGSSLLELFQQGQCQFTMRHIFSQIDEINHWLKSHKFGNLGSKIKDFIVEPSGKLYLVDFETYSPDFPRVIDVYVSIIYDIWERILIRRGRKTKLTRQFLSFFLHAFLRRPIKTVYLMIYCLLRQIWHTPFFSRVARVLNRHRSSL
jgi:hypothetical protein